jgi:hypothetical protein
MKTFKPLFLLVFTVLIASSCSMEKRLYNKGFHVEWRKNYKSPDKELAKVDFDKETELLEKTKNSYQSQNNYTTASIDESYSDIIEEDEGSDLSVEKKEMEIVQGVSSNPIVDSQNVPIETKEGELQQRRKSNKKTGGSGSGSGGKSQLIALILVLIVGALGVHRFYLGHIGIGVLMLLTGGVCGILVLVDLIRIITGDLKPKDGGYTETL